MQDKMLGVALSDLPIIQTFLGKDKTLGMLRPNGDVCSLCSEPAEYFIRKVFFRKHVGNQPKGIVMPSGNANNGRATDTSLCESCFRDEALELEASEKTIQRIVRYSVYSGGRLYDLNGIPCEGYEERSDPYKGFVPEEATNHVSGLTPKEVQQLKRHVYSLNRDIVTSNALKSALGFVTCEDLSRLTGHLENIMLFSEEPGLPESLKKLVEYLQWVAKLNHGIFGHQAPGSTSLSAFPHAFPKKETSFNDMFMSDEPPSDGHCLLPGKCPTHD